MSSPYEAYSSEHFSASLSNRIAVGSEFVGAVDWYSVKNFLNSVGLWITSFSDVDLYSVDLPKICLVSLLWLHLTATVVSYVVSYFPIRVALQSFTLLTLGVVPALGSYSVFLASPKPTLGGVEFYSVRVATLLSSGPAVGNIASSSAVLVCIAFFYKSFVEHVVHLDCSLLQIL